MELQRARPPEYSRSPETINWPNVPQHNPHQSHAHTDVTLPDLKTVLSAEYQHSPTQAQFIASGSPASARNLPWVEPQAYSNGGRRSMEAAVASPTNIGGFRAAEESRTRTTSVLSVDDPDIRDAAEALAGLGNPEYARSPPNDSAHVLSHASPSSSAHPHAASQQAEPLLHLLTQAHPWVGGTINNSLSAYSTTKGYAPRFVQASANMVERSIATPVVSTVGSVGRMTGVESVARWYLTPSRPGENGRGEDESGRSKRRRMRDDEMDVEYGFPSPRSGVRRDSQESRTESLPAYRASKPPSYREEASPATVDRARHNDRPSHHRSWSSQLLYSASGLGVAMSETSRSSLVYCLNILGRSAEHIATVANALKLVLEQYDQARDHWHHHHSAAIEKGERPRTPDHDDAARRLAEIIKKHCDDIWHTLKGVVNSVSMAAGGALPANARNFVRNQLMSLPQRWRMVSDSHTGESETSQTANRMIAFATEGLDMIGQVSQICKATLDSAEGWAQMVGRRRPTEQEYKGYGDQDHEMGDGDDEPYQHRTEQQ